MAEKTKKSAAEAFSEFSKIFRRSPQSRDNSKQNLFYPNELLQKKINAREEDYKVTVISAYKKYLNPYKTLGKTQAAQSIENDEKNLLKAYALFKAVHDANAEIGDLNTFADLKYIHSPLTQRDCYTIGGEFIYLQCWLIYSQNIRDFVPNLVEIQEKLGTFYALEFVPAKNYSFNFQDKEVLGIIQGAYHS